MRQGRKKEAISTLLLAQELAAGALYKTNPAKAIELLPLGGKASLLGRWSDPKLQWQDLNVEHSPHAENNCTSHKSHSSDNLKISRGPMLNPEEKKQD